MVRPIMRVTMISPPIFSLSEATNKGEGCPYITITATLEHTQPVTIYTRDTIFNLAIAQERHFLFCTDLTTDERLNLNTNKGGHPSNAVSCQLGHDDDQYWMTFYPNKTLSFTWKLIPAICGLPMRNHGIPRFKPGHRYRLGMDRIHSWCQKWLDGKTREDVLTTEAGNWRGGYEKFEIVVPPGDVVEFEVTE